MGRATHVARQRVTLCLLLLLETMGSSRGPPAVVSTSAASLGRPNTHTGVNWQVICSRCLSWLTWVVCCVHQNSSGILSGGWAQADRSVQVPRTASWAAVWCRHTVQVAIWFQGQTVQPWFCQGEMFIFNFLMFYCDICFYVAEVTAIMVKWIYNCLIYNTWIRQKDDLHPVLIKSGFTTPAVSLYMYYYSIIILLSIIIIIIWGLELVYFAVVALIMQCLLSIYLLAWSLLNNSFKHPTFDPPLKCIPYLKESCSRPLYTPRRGLGLSLYVRCIQWCWLRCKY